MKKFIIATFLIIGGFGIANAQTKEKTKVTKTTPAVQASAAKVTTTTAATSSNTAAIQKTTTKTALKKDGTPDKRYKEYKLVAKTTTGPAKKDGTPDMRYKKNKVVKK